MADAGYVFAEHNQHQLCAYTLT